jgi:hypothetical protein
MKKLLLIALILGVGASAAIGSPLCANAVTNAADFEGLGNYGCQFGDKIFYGFTYTFILQDSNGNIIPSNVPASSVAVQFSNFNNLSFAPVVSFSSNWDVINGQQGDIRISYSVSAPPSAAMYYSSVSLSGYVSNIDPLNQFNSYISAAESVCCVGPGNSSLSLGVELDPDPNGTVGLVHVTGGDSSFFTPATQIAISKDIFLSAGSDSGIPGGPPNGNEATLQLINQGLFEGTSIPEPLSFFLLGSGLVLMVFLMKRLEKSRQ